MTQPDLTTFHVLHRVMRQDAARLARAVATLTEDDRVARTTALARWYRGYLTELHAHHEIEDELFYPALRGRVPDAGPLIDRIDVDHVHLSDLLDRTASALARLADPAVAFRSVHAEAVMVTDGLRALLDSHLAFEDDEVVPLFASNFTTAQYDAIEHQAKKHMEVRNLLFVIPWIMNGATQAERERLFGSVPFAFKVIWFARRGGYRKLDAAAFGQLSLLQAVA